MGTGDRQQRPPVRLQVPTGISTCEGVRLSGRGYTFSTWIRVEDGREALHLQPEAQHAKHGRVVYGMLLPKEAGPPLGLVVAIRGFHLVAHTWGPRHAEVPLPCALQLNRWHNFSSSPRPGSPCLGALLLPHVTSCHRRFGPLPLLPHVV